MRHLILILFLAAGCSSDDAAGSFDEDVPDAASDADHDVGSDADAGEPDASVDLGEVADTGPPPESNCVRMDDRLRCDYETRTLQTGFTGLVPRDVHVQLPNGAPPTAGFPVVLLFQGSFFSGELAFEAGDADPFGAIHQVEFVQRALDSGYAVMSPEARVGGATYWDTNVPPYSLDWDLAPDNQFMLDIFSAIEAGEFGELDGDTMYATGISSGGYMSSRMAVSYPGRFRAIAVLSASYATCSGPVCPIPDLPADHPPTLFVHGEADGVVPIRTARAYHEALMGITETDFIASPDGGHAWLEVAPPAIVDWFDAH